MHTSLSPPQLMGQGEEMLSADEARLAFEYMEEKAKESDAPAELDAALKAFDAKGIHLHYRTLTLQP